MITKKKRVLVVLLTVGLFMSGGYWSYRSHKSSIAKRVEIVEKTLENAEAAKAKKDWIRVNSLLSGLGTSEAYVSEKVGELMASANSLLDEARANLAPKPGKGWKSTETGMEFVWVPALDMWVGKYEVTNGEYRKMVLNHHSGSYQGQSLNGDRQPVVNVNYDGAVAYAKWLTTKDHDNGSLPESFAYRLPTEDEWLKCARCDDGRIYPWGNDWPPRSGQAGNYSDAVAKSVIGCRGIDGYTDGCAVSCNVEDSFKNPWGLYGVGGNVWECTSERANGDFGAWRGGSWGNYDQDYLRCYYCYDSVGSSRFFDFGFRLVLSR